jgi:hypothetical protein
VERDLHLRTIWLDGAPYSPEQARRLAADLVDAADATALGLVVLRGGAS